MNPEIPHPEHSDDNSKASEKRDRNGVLLSGEIGEIVTRRNLILGQIHEKYGVDKNDPLTLDQLAEAHTDPDW